MSDELTELRDLISKMGSAETDAKADPTQVVQIRTTGGGSHDVPVTEPATIATILDRANLSVSPSTEYWVGGVVVKPDFTVGPGTIINAVGRVKGG